MKLSSTYLGELGLRTNGSLYGEEVIPDDRVVAQVRAVVTRVDAQLNIIRTLVNALAHSGVPPLTLVGVTAHVDQLQAAATCLAARPELAASVHLELTGEATA